MIFRARIIANFVFCLITLLEYPYLSDDIRNLNADSTSYVFDFVLALSLFRIKYSVVTSYQILVLDRCPMRISDSILKMSELIEDVACSKNGDDIKDCVDHVGFRMARSCRHFGG